MVDVAVVEPCADPDSREYVAQARAGLVAWHLANGEALRNQDVARICRMSVRGAQHLMDRLCLSLPIYYDRYTGTWQRSEFRELIA